MQFDTIVIGGGAAGMMAAYASAQSGDRTLLLEKNEKLGKKLFITGKGRCNVTNAGDMDNLFNHICRNPKFLYSAFYGFDNMQVMNLLEQTGCPLKTERGERVFPVSDHSSDVIAAFKRLLQKNDVTIKLNCCVKELITNDDRTAVTGVKTADGNSFNSKRVIVCTGGYSYQTTGSTGDGYRFAMDTGHKVTDIIPSLVPFETKESWCRELMGLSLKNVEITLKKGKRVLYSGFGEMLFTHFGVSGPLILSASSFYQPGAELSIDLKPAITEEQLDKRLIHIFEENKSKQFKNCLGELFPSKMIPVMVKLSGISEEKKASEISKEERNHFVRLIKEVNLTIVGTRGFEEAIITRGGVTVKDVNPSTMESKVIKNLYFAGEILDVDALTGGYNLQIAWSTGYLAGIKE